MTDQDEHQQNAREIKPPFRNVQRCCLKCMLTRGLLAGECVCKADERALGERMPRSERDRLALGLKPEDVDHVPVYPTLKPCVICGAPVGQSCSSTAHDQLDRSMHEMRNFAAIEPEIEDVQSLPVYSTQPYRTATITGICKLDHEHGKGDCKYERAESNDKPRKGFEFL